MDDLIIYDSELFNINKKKPLLMVTKYIEAFFYHQESEL